MENNKNIINLRKNKKINKIKVKYVNIILECVKFFSN